MKSRLFCAMVLAAGTTHAQQLQGDALVKALRQGGYVIVMRHASSPREAPDKATANPDNTKIERQLDQAGRDTATAMGLALHALKIPVGSVLSSPTYRALETVRYAALGNAQPIPMLGDNGQSMSGGTETQAVWLRQKVRELPADRTNTILVTHMPNMSRAFPDATKGLADGEALVFGPGGAVLARVKIEDWPKLAGGSK